MPYIEFCENRFSGDRWMNYNISVIFREHYVVNALLLRSLFRLSVSLSVMHVSCMSTAVF